MLYLFKSRFGLGFVVVYTGRGPLKYNIVKK